MKTIEQIIAIMENVFTYKGFDEEFLEDFCDRYDLSYRYGETRWVIYCDRWSEVLKIPRYDNVQEDVNHCEMEVDFYENAKLYRIEKIFLPIYKVATLRSGVEIYSQPKYTTSACETPYRENKRLREKINFEVGFSRASDKKMFMYDHYRINELWWSRAWQIYGKTFMRQLQIFSNDYCIGDLHGNNVGWLGKQPIILDYAGFNSEDIK
ncbi:MAG: hypothetical protein J6R67_03700 [Treponema sp.]|nr:hypothetical protein [Treponema sp.]